MSLTSLRLTQPDDWHLHLRDGPALATTVSHTAEVFARAIIMPNLQTPVTTVKQARAYRDRIINALPPGCTFEPLMTLYLTDQTSTQEIARAVESSEVFAVKYYPAGATTNSDNGVTDLANVYPVLEKMAELGLPLLLHGEVTDSDIDIFDREKVFIDTKLQRLRSDFPNLRMVFEHITTAEAAAWVLQQESNVAATITAHHLLYNRNDMLVGGIRPHYYCLPILKRGKHQNALIAAATSGDPRFFLGTDSAPHTVATKETDCGCAGLYSAPAALQLYAEVFEAESALDKLEAFASFHGSDFYGLERNTSIIEIEKSAWTMPPSFPFGSEQVVPIRAQQEISWRICKDKN